MVAFVLMLGLFCAQASRADIHQAPADAFYPDYGPTPVDGADYSQEDSGALLTLYLGEVPASATVAVKVASKPAVGPDGTLLAKNTLSGPVATEPHRASDDPTFFQAVIEPTPAWFNREGTYYWQAFYDGGDGNSYVTPVFQFDIVVPEFPDFRGYRQPGYCAHPDVRARYDFATHRAVGDTRAIRVSAGEARTDGGVTQLTARWAGRGQHVRICHVAGRDEYGRWYFASPRGGEASIYYRGSKKDLRLTVTGIRVPEPRGASCRNPFLVVGGISSMGDTKHIEMRRGKGRRWTWRPRRGATICEAGERVMRRRQPLWWFRGGSRRAYSEPAEIGQVFDFADARSVWEQLIGQSEAYVTARR